MKEYKLLTQDELCGQFMDCSRPEGKARAEGLLNRYAKEGWRVVAATSFNGYGDEYSHPTLIVLERDR